MFYLYRFIDSNDKVIYIGRTNDINRRILKEHFSDNTHLPNNCYLEISKIEVAKIENESEEVAYEAILINKIRPKYNIQFKDEGNFDIDIPELIWNSFEWEYEQQLDYLKMSKKSVVELSESILHSLLKPSNDFVQTGIIEVDNREIITESSLNLVAGVSGIGKTNYAIGICRHNLKQNKKILYISLRESIEDISQKILSINAGIAINKLISKTLSEEDIDNIGSRIESIKNLVLLYNTNINGCKIENIINEISNADFDLVVIDDLNTIEAAENNYDKDKMDLILKKLKYTAIKYNIPIFGLYTLSSKQILKRCDKRPLISDLDYDSLIEYFDNIHMLYRDEFYSQDTEDISMAEIIIEKNIANCKFVVKVAYVNGIFANIKK